jgi:hypothetical protein
LLDGRWRLLRLLIIAKLSLWEFAELVKQHNVEWVRCTLEEIEKEAKEASAADSKLGHSFLMQHHYRAE